MKKKLYQVLGGRKLISRWLQGGEVSHLPLAPALDYAAMAAAFPVATALSQSGALVLKEGGHFRSPKRHELAAFVRDLLVTTGQGHRSIRN
jgi:hypothetical protein